MNQKSGRIWINFKELRSRLKAEDVLRLYKVDVKRYGDQHQGGCPLPNHRSEGAPNSFSVHLEKGIFQCFGCKAKGNILEFAALIEGVDPTDGAALREVAVKLQQRFFPEGASTRTQNRPTEKPRVNPPEPEVSVNAPLDFELKGLEADHPWFEAHGYSAETISYFGIGFCSRGYLKDRLAFPLKDGDDRLIGYAGRIVDEKEVSSKKPLYLFPAKRERDGAILDFDRSLFLYNGSRIEGPCDNLIVVQDPEAVWWLNTHAFTTAVALLGNECSEKQFEAILRLANPRGLVWVMCRGDEAGDRLAQSLVLRIAGHRAVRLIDCGKGKGPTDLSAQELEKRFTL